MNTTPAVRQDASDEQRMLLLKTRLKRDKRLRSLLSMIGILGFLLLWQFLSASNILDVVELSSPIEVIRLFVQKLGDTKPDGAVLSANILASLQVSLTGLLLGIILGVPLGLLMGWYTGFERFMRPIFEIVRPIPPVSWIPLTIIWLGIGLRARAFIVFFAACVPCVINAEAGIRQTNQALINYAKTCGASNFEVFWKIGIPSSGTMVFTGMQVALGNAWATLVAAEMLASSAGLGYMILMGRQFVRVDLIILGIVVIGIIGAIFSGLLNLFESKVLAWKKG